MIRNGFRTTGWLLYTPRQVSHVPLLKSICLKGNHAHVPTLHIMLLDSHVLVPPSQISKSSQSLASEFATPARLYESHKVTLHGLHQMGMHLTNPRFYLDHNWYLCRLLDVGVLEGGLEATFIS